MACEHVETCVSHAREPFVQLPLAYGSPMVSFIKNTGQSVTLMIILNITSLFQLFLLGIVFYLLTLAKLANDFKLSTVPRITSLLFPLANEGGI